MIILIKINNYSAMSSTPPIHLNTNYYQTTPRETMPMSVPTNLAKDSDLDIASALHGPTNPEMLRQARKIETILHFGLHRYRPALIIKKRSFRLSDGTEAYFANKQSGVSKSEEQPNKRTRTDPTTNKQEEKTSSVPSTQKSHGMSALEADPRASKSLVTTQKQQNTALLSTEENYDEMPELEPDPDLLGSNSNRQPIAQHPTSQCPCTQGMTQYPTHQLTLPPNPQPIAGHSTIPLALALNPQPGAQYVAPQLKLVSSSPSRTEYGIPSSPQAQRSTTTDERIVHVIFSRHSC
ncbi:MAG: hypothetical protein AAGI90_00245 [Chlamydiota bacterium]